MLEGLFSLSSIISVDIHYEELRLQPTLSVIRSEIMFKLFHDFIVGRFGNGFSNINFVDSWKIHISTSLNALSNAMHLHLHTCEQATLISSLSPSLIHAWVVNVAELVTRDQLDIDILRHGGEGDLQPADGGRVVVVLDITGPAPGVYF